MEVLSVWFKLKRNLKEKTKNAKCKLLAKWVGKISYKIANVGDKVIIIISNAGNVGIGTTGPGYTLTVNGTAWVISGAWSGSDIRWKKDITPLSVTSSLAKVMQLNPVSFDWRTNEFPNMH